MRQIAVNWRLFAATQKNFNVGISIALHKIKNKIWIISNELWQITTNCGKLRQNAVNFGESAIICSTGLSYGGSNSPPLWLKIIMRTKMENNFSGFFQISTRVKPHSVLTKSQNGFLDSILTIHRQTYHISVLPRCHYLNDEDLNIWEELGANKLAFGEHQVCVSRT